MNAVKRNRFAALAVLAALPWVGAWACEGRVMAADGQAGVAGALVSDGRAVVASGEDGSFRLPDAPARLFVVAPDGWTVPRGDDGLPAFWREGCGDLRLEREDAPRADASRVLVFSDPQTPSPREVEYYARGAVATAAKEPDIAFGVTLGDITQDEPALYPALNRVTATLGVPWLHLPGNHDIDPGADDDASLASYHRVYGPDTYAWRSPHAVFVLLDNVVVLPGRRPPYVAGLRGEQFDFLENLLPHVPRDHLLVVATHIPWFDTAPPGAQPTVRTADRERLFALLRDFPNVLLLSGHEHTQRQFFHGPETGWHGAGPLREYNVGAVCGSFWSGEPDALGIPDSRMADGTPKGFAVLTIRNGGGYALEWRPVGLPEGDPAQTVAMALHAPKVLRRGAYPAWRVYANVFLGHEGTRVEYRIDGGEWKPMARVEMQDPRLMAGIARHDLADGLLSRDRAPEPEVSTHLWRGTLDTRLAAGVHRVEVRAFDDDGNEHRATVDYRLDEWQD